MINPLSSLAVPSMPRPEYPVLDNNLSFSDYTAIVRGTIKERRATEDNKIIEANSPYEFYPERPVLNNGRIKYGVLLIHGLLDCPFSLKDIGLHLTQQGMLARSVLLPGHGTVPSDLLRVSYHDWIQTVRYGVESLRKEVEQIYLVGYSTGAALSIYQAMHYTPIAGIILLSPAIKIKAPVDIAVAWHSFLKWLRKNNDGWLDQQEEKDYTKYISIPFNAVTQVSKLTSVIYELSRLRPFTTPLLMVMSREDETVSSARAIRFFSSLSNQDSRLLLYTQNEQRYDDPRIILRQSCYPELNIKNLSHVSLPFSPENPHYGKGGDYTPQDPTHANLYGAYNRLEVKLYYFLYRLGILKKIRRELTFNPDFAFMADKITQFILEKK